MTIVLAAIDNSAASRPVLDVALALAPAFGARVEAVHVSEDGGRTARASAERLGVPLRIVRGEPVEAISACAAAADVAAVVVGARGRLIGGHRVGHLALSLADRIEKPVVVVPPDARTRQKVDRVLIAVEGTPGKARALRRTVELASSAGLELVVLHVDDEASIPSFSDQVQHETEAYAREFLARHVRGAPDARLELRVGVPADEIVAAADALDPALIALGWPHTDDPHRGQVAREVLDRSHHPVLLVAVQ